MNIGKMRYRITIQEPGNVQDDYGNTVDDWQDVATVWADIVPVSGREYFGANQQNSETQYKVYIRYLDGITPKMRVLHDDKEYEILAVLGDQRAGYTTIMAKVVE